MNKITVYTTNTCPFCTMLKNFLTAQGVAYEEINVQRDQTAAKKLVSTTGQMGVPQTEINGQWVFGFDPDKIMSVVK